MVSAILSLSPPPPYLDQPSIFRCHKIVAWFQFRLFQQQRKHLKWIDDDFKRDRSLQKNANAQMIQEGLPYF